MEAFAKRALQMAITDIGTVRGTTAPTYFDRGTVDAASALEHVTGQALTDTLRGVPPYSQTVILFPPWPELFVSGADRPHGFEDAFAENERIRNALTRLEYDVFELPKTSVEERVDIILGATGRT